MWKMLFRGYLGKMRKEMKNMEGQRRGRRQR